MKIKKIHIYPYPKKIKFIYRYVYKNRKIYKRIKKFESEKQFYNNFKAYCPICNKKLKTYLYLNYRDTTLNFFNKRAGNMFIFKCKNEDFRFAIYNDGEFPSLDISFSYKDIKLFFELESDNKFHCCSHNLMLSTLKLDHIDYKNIGKLLALI